MSDIVERLRTVSYVIFGGEQVIADIALLSEAADEIEKLRTSLEAERKKHEWISLKDRWPEEGVWVLCIHEAFADAEHTFKDKQYDKIWSINAYGGYTHWMPLPDPPKKEEE